MFGLEGAEPDEATDDEGKGFIATTQNQFNMARVDLDAIFDALDALEKIMGLKRAREGKPRPYLEIIEKARKLIIAKKK